MPVAALRALLEQAIDYAGLFPPADLALEPALQNQAGYIRSGDRWMLGAFILPVGKLAAAEEFLAQFSSEHSLHISALGPKTARVEDFREVLETAAAAIEKFRVGHEGVASIGQFEIPLPPGPVTESLGATREVFRQTALDCFWETPAELATATIAALEGSGAGFKLRTGGVTADAFPSDPEIARALVAAATHRVPIKFTAGLHHPVKKFHASVGTKMPGFLNVLGAGVLAAEHAWDENQTEKMLADEDPASFAFGDAFFAWREWKISTEQIAARRPLVRSLGSCSFDEPRDDLRALGLF